VQPDFIEFIGNARKRRSEKFRNQLYIFVVCLVLSFFIWALVRLSKDYYYSVQYRLIYSEVPSNLKLTSASDTTLSLKIKVQGFDLFSEKFIAPQDREFDVSLRNVRIRYSEDHIWGYMLTNRIGREIVSQSNCPSDVFFVAPDTLFFDFEKQSIRRVPPRQVTDFIKSPRGIQDSLRRRPDTLVHHAIEKAGTRKP